MPTRSSILAWKIPWTEEPGGLQSMGPQGIGHNLSTKQTSFFEKNQDSERFGFTKANRNEIQVS